MSDVHAISGNKQT